MKHLKLFVFLLSLGISGYACSAEPNRAQQKPASRSAAPSCPSQKFSDFLKAFAESEKLQRAFTSTSLQQKVLFLDNGPEPVFKKSSTEGINFPIIPPESARTAGALTLSVDYAKGGNAVVNLMRNEWDTQASYTFQNKNGCWQLVERVDLSVPGTNGPVSAHPARAAACLKRGNDLEQGVAVPANKSMTGLLSPQEHDRALYAYLCAARAGSAEGAYLAAALGNSGQSRFLPRDYTIELYLQASEKNADAALILANLYCGDDKTCQDTEKAQAMMIKAAKMGSNDAFNLLGVKYERGEFGAKDIERAMACYQLGAKANPMAKASLQQLLDKGHQLTGKKCF